MTEARTLHVGGIQTQIYGLQHLSKSSEGIAVLFFLHGRFGSSADSSMIKWAESFVSNAATEREKAGGQGKQLVVVTFDQRNHGGRTVDSEKNKGWREGNSQAEGLDNEAHAVDMLAIQTGTARDVSFLIDFLEPTLWPNAEQAVTDWWCAGISLGGHSTWLALAHEPRITLGVPIIGSPSVLDLLSHRAANLPAPHGPLPISSPYFPTSLLRLIERDDPINVPRSVWKGRKILVLSGGADELVNYVHGATDRFVEVLRGDEGVGEDGVVDVWVQEGTGHKFSSEMVSRANSFLWEHGLRTANSAKAGARM